MKVDGRWPFFSNLAEVMDEDPALLDDLADAYEAQGGTDVEQFVVADLPATVVGRLLGDGEPLPLRSALWLVYVQGYWSGVAIQEMFKKFGIARGADELGVAQPRDVSAADVQLICDLLAPVHKALRGSTEEQAKALDDCLRLEIQWGALYGVAYTVGFYVPTLLPPPEGAKPDHIKVDSDLVSCSADRMLDVDYRDAMPQYLAHARARHDEARATHPEQWEAVVAGAPGSVDLRDVWRHGFDQCIYNWGADSLQGWEQGAYDAMLRWNLDFGFPIEAIAHEALAALTTGEPAAITRALQGAALTIPMWLATATGIGDAHGTRPRPSSTDHYIVS